MADRIDYQRWSLKLLAVIEGRPHIVQKNETENKKLCGEHEETLDHIAAGCSVIHGLATARHDQTLGALIFEKLTYIIEP